MHRENHMIIIGISEYADPKMKNLPNARPDAERLLKILREKYNFQVWEKPLYDAEATRKQIGALIRSITTVFKDDNLLIFFAGHGLKDPYEDIGYWVPTEASRDLGDCYSNSDVITYVERSPARHVLLISDSCFCGTFIKQTRAATVSKSHDELDALSSRWVFVSGGIDTVNDGMPGQGSPFGKSLIHFLESNQAPSVAAEELYEAVAQMTKFQSWQQAEAQAIVCPQNLGGQMIFRLSVSNNTGEVRGVEEEILQRSTALPKIAYYIPRTVSTYSHTTDELPSFLIPQAKQVYLRDLITTESRIVLLGSAGSGKSVELLYLTRELAKSGSGLIPIYKRLNSYVNENIEDFVQGDWHKLNPERVVLVLDGLDEIQPQHFYTAVRKIQTFFENNPLVKLVISCRTNFYEFPSETFVGTLEGFSVQLLNDISLAEISKFVFENWGIDGKTFVETVNTQGYLDLVSKPYFLEVLINYYKKNGNLSSGRFEIMAAALDDYYEESKAHFNAVIQYPAKKHVLKQLEKIAFIMETMGKNFLTDDELADIFELGTDYDLIRYLPLFKKNEENGRWMFVHNNIQEFLASSVLKRQPFEKVIELISIQSTIGSRIKPTWVNTVSFFISIADRDKVNQLLQWIIDNDQETLIRFEPERIGKDTRISVFKNVFESYNAKRIWLSSNKFTDADLARFGNYPEIIEYLFDLIDNPDSVEIVILNTVHVLDNFELSQRDEYKKKIRDSFLRLLSSDRLNAYGKYAVMTALARLRITDKELIENVVSKFQKSQNQYIRSGLYRLLHISSFINDYAEVFFDGIVPERRKGFDEDRDDINLMDEKFNLELGLRKITDPSALKELLQILVDIRSSRFFYYSDVKEIIDDVTTNSINAYKTDPTIFDAVLNFLLSMSPLRHGGVSTQVSRFFTETLTKNEAVRQIWRMDGMSRYRQEEALVTLLDEDTIDNFLYLYKDDQYIASDLELLFKIVNSNSAIIPNSIMLAQKIADAGAQKDQLKLSIPEAIDWAALNKIREQSSFDLLFDKSTLKEAVRQIFTELGKEKFGKDEYYELRKQNGEDIEDNVLPIVAEIIRNILFDKASFNFETQTVSFSEIENWLDDDRVFNAYRIERMYTYLNNQNNTINMSDDQREFISKWCMEDHGEYPYLWFFIHRLNIQIQPERLTPFTLYFDHSNEAEIEFASTIEQLERFLPKPIIIDAVSANLSNPQIGSLAWITNAGYALRNNLANLYPYIVQRLKAIDESEYKASEVLEFWFSKTSDCDTLIEIIKQTNSFDIRQRSIGLLKHSGLRNEFLIEYFINKINGKHTLPDEKIYAANDLIQLGRLEGLYFLTDWVHERKDATISYSRILRSFKTLTDVSAIDPLMSLLAFAMEPSFNEAGRFDRLETPVLEAIYSIGIQSEANFEKVKNALLDFIEKNTSKLPNINFLHINIARMGEQLDLNISKTYDIKDVIREFKKLED